MAKSPVAAGDWSNAGNWNEGGGVPDVNDDVALTENVTLDIDGICKSLTITPGKKLTVDMAADGDIAFEIAEAYSDGSNNSINITGGVGDHFEFTCPSFTATGMFSSMFQVNSPCDITFNGDLYGGNMFLAMCLQLITNTTGLITINGNIYGGTGPACVGLNIASGATIIVQNGTEILPSGGDAISGAHADADLTIIGMEINSAPTKSSYPISFSQGVLDIVNCTIHNDRGISPTVNVACKTDGFSLSGTNIKMTTPCNFPIGGTPQGSIDFSGGYYFEMDGKKFYDTRRCIGRGLRRGVA